MSISADYSRICESIGRTDPEFSQALQQWGQHFCSTVFKLSKITKRDTEDVFQNLLAELVRVRDTYRIPLYRFNGRLWEAEIIDGPTYLLCNPRHNKTHMDPIWAGESLVSPVRKGKLSSVVYREITQQYSDVLAAYFCRKNGFEKIKVKKDEDISIYKYANKLYESTKKDGNFLLLTTPKDSNQPKESFWVNSSEIEKFKKDTRMVTIRSGKKSTKLVRKAVNRVRRVVEEVSLWEPVYTDSDTMIADTIKSPTLNPEEILILGELLGFSGKEKNYPVHSTDF